MSAWSLSSSSRPFTSGLKVAALAGVMAVAPALSSCTAPATSPTTAAALQSAVTIDVRTPGEHADGHLKGDHNIPVDEVERRVEEILGLAGGKKDAKIIVYCASGRRSGRAKAILEAAGFTNVENAGGFSGLKSAHPELVAPRP